MNNIQIQTGDVVKHKTIIMNGGLGMNVIDTTDNQALVDYFDIDSVNRQKWIDKTDLEIIHKNDGGFRNEGE